MHIFRFSLWFSICFHSCQAFISELSYLIPKVFPYCFLKYFSKLSRLKTGTSCIIFCVSSTKAQFVENLRNEVIISEARILTWVSLRFDSTFFFPSFSYAAKIKYEILRSYNIVHLKRVILLTRSVLYFFLSILQDNICVLCRMM